ncbi:MAG: hypothetical protein AB1529_08415 [Candidatus Micrarchaeota archaeon]
MEAKKPLKQRLKQDLVVLVLVLMLLGGAGSFMAASPFFVPAVAAMLLLTFGPYLVEYLGERRKAGAAEKKGRIAFSAMPGRIGGKEIRFEER